MSEPQNNSKPAPKGDIFAGLVAFALLFGLTFYNFRVSYLEARLLQRTQELERYRSERDILLSFYTNATSRMHSLEEDVRSIQVQTGTLLRQPVECRQQLHRCSCPATPPSP